MLPRPIGGVRFPHAYRKTVPVTAEGTAGSSITRALRVVEAVAAAGDGVTAKAIARRLGTPLPTVYRTLGTLVDEGYLVRLHDVRGYGLGYRVADLHRSLAEQVLPPPGVRRVLHEVHTAVGAAAYYAVFRDVEIVVAHIEECTACAPSGGLRVGEPTAPHATAGGKVMLAGLRPPRLAELLAHAGLPQLAPRTVPDRRALDRELMRIRSAGAAVEVDEFERGRAGVAAPVHNASGDVTGAVGVSVSRTDFTSRRWDLERAVRQAAVRATLVTPPGETRAGGGH
ncbi:MAG: IclR family transcriptional regulator [Pseudonocardia sp.]